MKRLRAVHHHSFGIRLISIRMAHCEKLRGGVRTSAQAQRRRFGGAYAYPELLPVAEVRNQTPPSQLAAEATAFALSHEADA